MQKKHIVILIVVMMMTYIIAACNPINTPTLSIQNWSPSELTLTKNTNEQVNFSITLNKEANCAWQAASGALSTTNGLATTWTAPATAGTYTVKATANDGVNSAKKEWTITVIGGNPQNNPPVIESHIPASPYNIQVNNPVQLSVVASDEDGDNLVYTWSKTGGTLDSTAGNSVNWTAPATAGTYTVKIVVSDGTDSVDFTWTMNVSTDTPSNVIIINEHVLVPTTWEGSNVYVITREDLEVRNTLTIKAGAIIKFAATNYPNLSTAGSGLIKALGTSSAPIIFTSYKDDNWGGDTNGDGNVSTPEIGDWGSIKLAGGTGSVFDYCQFYYGGKHSADFTLHLGNTQAQVTNCTFANNCGKVNGVVDARSAAVGTKIENNTFYNNVKPLSINSTFSIDDSNQFHNPADQSQINTNNGIFVATTLIQSPISWSETEVPFVLTQNLDVCTGYSLTLGDNVIIKISDAKVLTVGGTLNAEATNSIIFTSYHDDDHGGDTNGNGTGTIPNAGDWARIDINSTLASKFVNCQFYYGGSGGSTTLELGYTSSAVKNCTFAHNLGLQGALNAPSALNGTVIADNIFYDNEVPLLINGNFSISDSNIFHNPTNPAEKNLQNGIFFENYFMIGNAIAWEETEVPFVILECDIPVNKSLTLGDNVVIKFKPTGHLDIVGTLNAKATTKNVFTSFKDDSVLGNTNNDSSVLPARGDWKEIYIAETGSAFFTNCEFYYGGVNSTVNVAYGRAEVINCIFAHNTGYALNARNGNTQTKIESNTFFDNKNPLAINLEFSLNDSNNFQSADGTIKNDYNRIDFYYDTVESAISWGETEVPYYSIGGFSISVDNSLALADNVIVKMAQNTKIDLLGSLSVGSNVWFTSIKDDVHGGDSNADGGVTAPAAGDWIGIYSKSLSDYIKSWTAILYDTYSYPINYQ